MPKAAKKIAVGAAIAGSIGYLAGLLTAPKAGKETRAELKDAATTSLMEAEKELKKLHTELSKLITQVKNTSDKLSGKAAKDLEAIIEKTIETKEKAREVISAVHEGDAQDRDLAEAIKDARRAIDSLKDYLDK